MQPIRPLLLGFFLTSLFHYNARAQKTPFELNGQNYTANYTECIDFYRQLDRDYEEVQLIEMGPTDAGLPLHLVVLSADGIADPAEWHRQNKTVILVNNGIHPGEPDGIDASMMLCRDVLSGEYGLPENVALAFIPVYNIGGCLNRSPYRRVDQNGPESFGSRGNSQNLDLNRDFIKCDSKEARSFAEIFQWLDPDIFIDNHVSDGADYPNVMTLATSQHNKLGGVMGKFLHETFEPSLFSQMEQKGFPMLPYVNVWGKDARQGWQQFFDAPRYSTGYATLFHSFGFTPETHMLKPYPQRVEATLALMQCIIDFAAKNSDRIKELRAETRKACLQQKTFPLTWTCDESRYTRLDYRGYEYKTKTSAVSALPVKYYDREAVYRDTIRFYNYYVPALQAEAPEAYLIPQGWWKVIDLLKLNGVQMKRLPKDTQMTVEYALISDYQSSATSYEGHHANSQIQTELRSGLVSFRQGDYLVPLAQDRKRFIVEVLEPRGNDSYFAWNYFDPILVQKEGYSDYAYEDLAAEYLEEHPEVKAELVQKRQSDLKFAGNAAAQLDFVFKRSPYYEEGHNRYPVYRLLPPSDQKLYREQEAAPEIKNKHDE